MQNSNKGCAATKKKVFRFSSNFNFLSHKGTFIMWKYTAKIDKFKGLEWNYESQHELEKK